MNTIGQHIPPAGNLKQGQANEKNVVQDHWVDGWMKGVFKNCTFFYLSCFIWLLLRRNFCENDFFLSGGIFVFNFWFISLSDTFFSCYFLSFFCYFLSFFATIHSSAKCAENGRLLKAPPAYYSSDLHFLGTIMQLSAL